MTTAEELRAAAKRLRDAMDSVTLLQPPVGGMLADWLEQEAKHLDAVQYAADEVFTDAADKAAFVAAGTHPEPVALARQINGTEVPS